MVPAHVMEPEQELLRDLVAVAEKRRPRAGSTGPPRCCRRPSDRSRCRPRRPGGSRRTSSRPAAPGSPRGRGRSGGPRPSGGGGRAASCSRPRPRASRASSPSPAATRAGSFPNVRRIHSSAIAPDVSSWSQARRPKAYQFAQANTEPHQLRSVPMLATPGDAGRRRGRGASRRSPGRRWSPRPSRAGVRPQHLLEERRQVHEVRGEAEVLLRDLELQHQRRLRHRAEEGVERLAGLEVDAGRS